MTIDNFAYAPSALTVAPGSKVTVVNKDSVAHTLTATTGKAFDTGTIGPGKTATFTAPAKAGAYPYICTIHPFMKGTLTVR
ncbi:cupredoxin domain-containing protein [Streptomyces sp. NPDC059096]|uniref:cupredoxin domain-containing protein n=1 Tax=Streptomyces sp. NPDC059096 TaxID=3346727 RepID=UPI003697B72C